MKVIGTLSGARLNVEWYSMVLAPSASLIPSMRDTISSRAMRRFMRARLEPAQRCGPAPKAMWRLRARSGSNSSGASNSLSSRLAETQF